MKEIALLGVTGPVYGNVLTGLLEDNLSVNAMVTDPEHVMLDTTNITVTRYDAYDKEASKRALTGYDTVIIAYETDYQNAANNDLMLDTYSKTVNAAIEAGVKNLIVVGGKFSEAFLTGELRRHSDLIDAKYISTEGNYAKAVVDELTKDLVTA